jgi:hypothetical protein
MLQSCTRKNLSRNEPEAMKQRNIVTLILFLLLMGACSREHFSGSYLVTSASLLTHLREQWIKQSKPGNFDPSQYAGPAGAFSVFTNVVTAGGRDYHCQFGTRRQWWPKGILAITADGVVLWVRDRDSKVTLSPMDYGIDMD